MTELRLDQLKFDPDRKWWWWLAPSADGEFDVIVPGGGETPDVDALPLANLALSQLDELVKISKSYYTHFIDLEKASLTGEPELVSLSSGFSPKVVRVTLNYESDVYGLWWVELRLENILGFTPFSFGRTNW